GIREDGRDLVLARQRQVRPRPEAFVPDVEHVAQWTAALRARQQFEKSLQIVRVEYLRGHELPDDRSELVAEFGDAAVHEAGDRIAGGRELLAVGRETRRLQREHEAVGRFVGPLTETGR